LHAEKLHAGLHQLMSLVENRGVDRGQQLGHATVAQRQVGKEQMVIDHHQVSGHRLAPRAHHVAIAVRRALGAQAILAGRGDQWNHRRTFIQPF
jgi:hypothetical protein